MIQRTLEQKTPKDKDKDKDSPSPKAGGKSGGSNVHTTTNGTENTTDDKPKKKHQVNCFLCGKSDHVSTKGPFGMKLIQYFTCEKFANLLPGEREKQLTGGSGYRDPQSWSYFSQKSKKSHVLLTFFK